MAANTQAHGLMTENDSSDLAGESKARAGERRRRKAAGQDPAKRRQILDGAKRCFMNLGYEAASMNEITAEAGVSKGTLYVYFADKEDLFGSMIDSERAAIMEVARNELDHGDDIADALRRFAVALSTHINSAEVIRAMRMVLGIADRMPKLAMRFFGPDPDSGLEVLKRYLDRQVAAGELTIDDTDTAARQFLDLAMAGIFKKRLFGNMPNEASVDEISAVVGRGVDMFLTYYGKARRRPGA